MNRRSPRHKGVYQRCRADCPADRCRTHRWGYAVELPAGPGGQRRQLAKAGFETASAAAAARAEVVRQHRAGMLPTDPTLTVGDWLRRWLAARVERGELRPSTAADYRDSIERFLAPRLGQVRLGELRGAQITAAYDAMRREREQLIERAEAANRERATQVDSWNAEHPHRRPRKPHREPVPRPLGALTMHRIHTALSAALKSAVRQGLVPMNVAANAERVKAVRPRVRVWEPAQLGQFLDAISGQRLAPMLHLGAFAGLRRGELCGLAWVDVDLEAGRLTVQRQRVNVRYTVVDGVPKTASGQGRVVDLDAATVEVLRAWRRTQVSERLAWGPAWTDTGLVFTREDGTGWHPDAVTKTFTRLVRGAGLPPLKLHGLRHMAVSLQLAGGVDPMVIAMRTGHSSTALIRSTYGHLIGEVGKQAAEAAAAIVPRRNLA